MSLYALGLNHQTAPLPVRERVVFHVERMYEALRDVSRRAVASEVAILSTCNRTELYVAEPGEGNADLSSKSIANWLTDYHRLKPRELDRYLYVRPSAQAVRHAFRVASGLDSMVLGEPQILGQMKEAARSAEAAGTLGTVLHKLFQRSFSVAKEVRTTTKLGASSVSMAAATVRLAGRIFPSMSEQAVLFIGAGEMIELCATHFAARAPARLGVANRTLERGRLLAHRFNGESIDIKDIGQCLHEYDIVVSCTASSLPILGKGLVERALRARRRKPMFMVDLAVPRDIEPEVAELDDVFLYSLDDLSGMVSAGADERRSAVAQAEAIVETQVGQFMRWMAGRGRVPVIRALREHAELARERELARALRRLLLGADPKLVMERLSKGLTNKLIHAPTQALHDAPDAESRAIADLVARLFRLPG